ncbi:MAG: zinc-binding dehydrogenase [Ahrensia sp.]|nr:zinc-binding dehydrogenase [Ahrensia sp.]
MKALLQKHDGYTREKPDSTVLSDMGPWVELAEIDTPEPAEGQVRIKVSLASINPSDEMFIQGLYGQPRQKGRPAGFEGVGVIEASGGGQFADSLVGQRVAFAAGPNGSGAWADYAITDAAGVIPLIEGVRDEDGAAMIVNPLTALAMFDIVKEVGEKSFIITAGASQLCKLMIKVARDEGYEPIAIVRRDSQIDMLKELGAAHVLNCESDGFAADLYPLCRSAKPRVFLDAVANNQSAQIFDAMPNRARWVIYGKLDDELPTIMQPGQMIFMMKQIEGFWLTRWMQEKDMGEKMGAIQKAQQLFASGEWQTDVTAIVPLSQAMDRVPEELAKPNGKVFIKPD